MSSTSAHSFLAGVAVAPPVQQVAGQGLPAADSGQRSVIQHVCALKDAADSVKVPDNPQVGDTRLLSLFVL